MQSALPSKLPPAPPGQTGWMWAVVPNPTPSANLETHLYPKLSIVTPSYNQGNYLEKTIRSVLLQGYPNLEYIVIDGGSTDNSVEIIKKYEPWLTFWKSEKDRGQSHAINKGFQQATGKIFGWINSDDYYYPQAFNDVAQCFLEHPDAGAVVGGGDMFYEAGNRLLQVESFEVTLDSLYNFLHKFFMQPSCFFKQEVWNECGPLDENLQLAMDLDLWLKIVKKQKFALTNKNLSCSLVHGSAKTTALAAESYATAILVIYSHGGVKEAREQITEFVERGVFSSHEFSSLKMLPIRAYLKALKFFSSIRRRY
ncbi:glycosyltransferase family 2 protein [Pseudomonadota bacterium]